MDIFCLIYTLLTSFLSSTALSAKLDSKNWKFSSRLDGHVLSSLSGLSMAACWKACKERRFCKSVNYQRNFHRCEMNAETVDEVSSVTLTRTKGWVYYHNSNEEQCSKSVNTQTGTCRVKECIPHTVEHGTVTGNMLTVGSRVRVDCNEGFMTTSGPSVAVVSECTTSGTFTPTYCFPVTCMKIAESPFKVKGAYKSYDTGSGKIVDIFCDYDLGSNIGYTFLSKTTLHHVSSLSNHYNRLDHVSIRHYGTDVNAQYSSKMAVLSTHRDQYPNVSLFLSEYPDFNPPKEDSHKPYLHIGFVPSSFGDHSLVAQGYACNGHDYTFNNCDGNPNNNFIFYQNRDGSISKGGCCQSSYIMSSWRSCGAAVNPTHNIPDTFFYDTYEIHMGGCGGFVNSNVADVSGVIFGFLFDYS